VALNFNQEAREADLRYGLVRVRENAESIAFYGGEGSEMRALVQVGGAGCGWGGVGWGGRVRSLSLHPISCSHRLSLQPTQPPPCTRTSAPTPQRLNQVVSNYYNLLINSRNLDFFTSFYRFLIQLLPAAVVAPLFFQRKIEFGVVTQSSVSGYDFGPDCCALHIFSRHLPLCQRAVSTLES
jgi:hypothetical protein